MKVLLAGVSVRSIAQSAAASGYPVVALDAFGDQDLRAVAETHTVRPYSAAALVAAAGALTYDALAYTSSLENHPEAVRGLAGSRPVLGNPPEVLRRVRNAPELFALLRAAGFRAPKTVVRIARRSRRRWLAKPASSGGGHGVKFFDRGRRPAGGRFLQEYIPGKPFSASFVANGHEAVLIGIAEQLIGRPVLGARGFRYCGSILPLPAAREAGRGGVILRQVRSLAGFLTRECGLRGVNGIDCILRGDEVWPIEVNPRYSASMELIERAYRLPVFQIHALAAGAGTLPLFSLESKLLQGGYWGKGILFAETDAAAPDTRPWPGLDIRDIPAPGESFRKGAPVCTILADGRTRREALSTLTSRAGMLKREIYDKGFAHYRAFHRAGSRHLGRKGPAGIPGVHPHC